MDLVPDWIPGAGLVDDLAVLVLVVAMVTRAGATQSGNPEDLEDEE